MSSPPSRLKNILGHLGLSSPAPKPEESKAAFHIHQLSPTYFLERAAAIEPDAEAIVHITANNKLLRRTYRDFAERATGLAYYLKKHGFQRVGILAPNTPAFLESIFGIALAGGVNVAVNYRLKSDDITYIFDYAEVDSIIVDQEFLHLLDEFKQSHPSVPFIIDTDTDAIEGELSGPFDEAILEGLQFDQKQGNKSTVNTLLCSAKEAEELPKPCRVTVAASPPSGYLFEQMTNLNLIPVHVYGMTETYGPITKGYHMPSWDSLPPNEKYAKMARQGHGFLTSLPIRVIKQDQPEGVLIDVAKDGKEIGEIIFKGNICCKEYYKDPEATKKLFAGGFLHSGDLAVMHEDGAAQILDRAKDIIISGGENISSVALEGMLVQHPDLLEAAVVAIPDSHWGERPKAYVTVKEGKSLQPEDLISWAKHQSNISKFMVPREVEVVDELPKTSTGKLKKNVLREWAKHGRKE
ncbi:AMP-binding domain protein [Colletotrichum sp. SAR 10_70]|nr:AMP-binding domain protein [Colletotrichum sp. SAR 10_71]KAI8161389.1 AMP-binding domain protein [Colletotrichum sp. SAR 10_70]KAI8217023.1 AMP-binding domain protein [Colletotrichum sp. SAR 10_77]KAI8218643.1 AMP-binding domain protein [Colletotrichum sp. SAR 10_86]